MCGISGIISAALLNEDDIAALRAINAAMIHRGPDADGFTNFGHVALAMRRLSIVDLAGGSQPITNEDGSISIVCNGEIYNHHDLRRELTSEGHVFRTKSDIETIVHCYEQYGCDRFLTPLRGMFAFALWDDRAGRLTLARDRLGEKPLYLYRDQRADGAPRLWFASELHAILKVVPPGRRRLSAQAFNEFMTFQYVLDPGSPIEGITQLRAAFRLDVSVSTIERSPVSYWSLGQTRACDNDTRAVDAVRAGMEVACRRMGSADVPVGVALSGGIDSSLVAAITARHYPGQLQAFTVGYPGRPENDERAIAARFAQQIGVPLMEIEIPIDEVVDSFPQTVSVMDTPIADIAAFGYYCVTRAARRAGIPVLVSGMGGDEMFWGYEWVRNAVGALALDGSLLRREGWKSRILGALTGNKRADIHETSIYAPHKEFAAGNAVSFDIIGDRAGIASDHWLEVTRPRINTEPSTAVAEILNATWLVGNCLTLLDRMSMAHSVEMRVPFLDIDLVERLWTMRRDNGLSDWRMPHKSLLLETWGHILPEEIRCRRKQGFTPPVAQWISSIVERWGHTWRESSAIVRAGLATQQQINQAARTFTMDLQYKMTVFEIWARSILT